MVFAYSKEHDLIVLGDGATRTVYGRLCTCDSINKQKIVAIFYKNISEGCRLVKLNDQVSDHTKYQN